MPDPHREDQSLCFAILRHQGQTQRLAFGHLWAGNIHRLAFYLDRPSRIFQHTKERQQQFFLPLPIQPPQAQYFTATQRDIDIIELVFPAQILYLQYRWTLCRRRFCRKDMSHIAADHQFHNLFVAVLALGKGLDMLAIAKHAHHVGQLFYFAHAV